MAGINRPPNMEQYILDHLAEALEQDHIKVYVQPVVRTLTRQVCGLEALARWQDPAYGLLMPGEFIPVLEKHRLIHRLDTYVLRKVCENYSSSKKQFNVPVSINLSRLDYELCDIFEVVDAAVRANKMPRSNLCIEITESTLASNESLMRQYIDRFRSAGYSVWMDDFGSGYSTLNVLKDYLFDELKIDMRFLSDFHTRSKKILSSIVHMAKEIGIQTLAEGVETEEQFLFLRSIGCEKVQGYLFGKPMPYDECQDHVANAGMTWEPPKLRRYYDDIGRLDVLSPSPFRSESKRSVSITGRELNSIPLAIVELNGDSAQMLYSNQAFDETASAVDWPLLWCQNNEPTVIPISRISQRLQKLLEDAKTEGEGKLLSVYDNEYYEMRAHRLARHKDICSVLMNVTNLSQMSAMASQQQLDDGLRSLYSVYELVLLINLNDRTVVSLHMDRESDHELPTGSLLVWIEEYVRQRVFPDDQERFMRFICPETMEARAALSGSISTYLRVLSYHGAYDWKSFQLVRIRENIYYLLIHSAENEVLELKSAYRYQKYADDAITSELLWENVVNRADLKFFWKDRERRFVGVSQSFLNYYSIPSLSEIVGKTDEDMGWHIHNDPYRDEEWKVLREGITSRNVVGHCLVQGEDLEIVATKMPLFSRDGKIVGLIGTFDQTDTSANAKGSLKQARTDNLTGLLNSRGVYEDLYAYIDEYELRERDFAQIDIAIDDFEDINARYGYDFGDAVIRETGRALLRCCGNTATVGRVSGCYYTVLHQFEDAKELDTLIARIRQIPAEIKQIDGVPFSIYLSVGMALYSETKNRESMSAQAELRRMTDDVENVSLRQLIENTGRIFQMFDDLPVSYAVYKIINGKDGGDAIVLYANKKFLKMADLTPEKLIGKRVSSFFMLSASNWFEMAEQAGIEGKSVTGCFHDVYTKRDINITAYPVIGPGFCAFTFQIVMS